MRQEIVHTHSAGLKAVCLEATPLRLAAEHLGHDLADMGVLGHVLADMGVLHDDVRLWVRARSLFDTVLHLLEAVQSLQNKEEWLQSSEKEV